MLTEIEVASENFSFGATDLVSTLDAAMEAAGPFARSRGVEITLDAGGTGCVIAKRDLLLKAIQTLLETAVKFSQPGEAVGMKCQTGGGGVQVLIRGGGRTRKSAMYSSSGFDRRGD